MPTTVHGRYGGGRHTLGTCRVGLVAPCDQLACASGPFFKGRFPIRFFRWDKTWTGVPSLPVNCHVSDGEHGDGINLWTGTYLGRVSHRAPRQRPTTTTEKNPFGQVRRGVLNPSLPWPQIIRSSRVRSWEGLTLRAKAGGAGLHFPRKSPPFRQCAILGRVFREMGGLNART